MKHNDAFRYAIAMLLAAGVLIATALATGQVP